MNVHSAKSAKPTPRGRKTAKGSQTVAPETLADGKREVILDAALRVFAVTGMDGTNVPRIAHAANLGVGTLYRYFANKEELVNEVYRAAKMKLKHRLSDGFDFNQEPRNLFHEFWRRLVAFAVEESDAFRFLELQDHVPYLDEESHALELEVLAPIYLVCIEMQKAGIFNDALRAEVAMAMVWGAFVGVFKAESNFYFKTSAADLDSVRDACWRALTKPGKGR